MAASPLILNNPVLTKALQQRAAAAQQQPQGLGTPPIAPATPQPDMHVQVTHTVPGEGPDLGTSVPGAPPSGFTPQPTASMKPLAKVAAPQPNPAELAHQTEYNRLTGAGPNPAEGKSGIQQIKNPVGRTLLQIADAVGGGLFPNIAANIPGTELHHRMLTRNAQGELAQEQKARGETAAQGLEAAKAEHQINMENKATKPDIHAIYAGAVSDAIDRGEDPANDPKAKQALAALTATTAKEPQEKEALPAMLAEATRDAIKNGRDPADDPKVKQIIGVMQNSAKPPAEKEGEMPLGDRVQQINAALARRYQVLHKGVLPPEYMLPPNATQKDAERISGMLKDEEGAQGTKAQRDQAQQNHQETMAMMQQNREQKSSTEMRTAAAKAYAPAMDSAERFNVMAKNYEDAVKNHDQQAMLSLLANHLGMTMGLQKGSRLTRDIIKEAQTSRPWLQGMAAKFDKDGYLTGVTLTPQQMRQMVDLGRERFSEDTTKAKNESDFIGFKDEGPTRTPSKATINHYTALANGDAKKAKELAAADGWTVK